MHNRLVPAGQTERRTFIPHQSVSSLAVALHDDATVVTLPRLRKPGGPEAIRAYLHQRLPTVVPVAGDCYLVYSSGTVGKMPDKP